MAELSYGCPAPGCSWTITDSKAEEDSLGAVAMIKWNERFGITAKETRLDFARRHDAKLHKIILDHLKTHGLEDDPNIGTAAQYVITMTRLRAVEARPTKDERGSNDQDQ